jgi:hypothetical protein
VKKPKYALFGIHRSGTNYLTQLLLKNFNAGKRQGYWKHSLEVPETWNQEEPAFLIYKNPVTWTESIIRKKVDWNKTQTRYPATEEHDNPKLMVKGNNIENLMKTWVDFHDTWFFSEVMRSGNKHIIRYEDLLDDELRNNHLDHIAEMTGWDPIVSEWENIEAGGVPESRFFKEEKKEVYAKGKAEILSPDQVEFVKDFVGRDRLSEMRY